MAVARIHRLFFSEDGPFHVQRRLVTGKKWVQLAVPPNGGKRRGAGTGTGTFAEPYSICISVADVKETSFSLAWKPTGVDHCNLQ